MAGKKKIHELSNEALSVGADDFFVLDVDDGGGNYTTSKIKGSNLGGGIDVNTTPVTNGATGRVFFQKSDATVGQDERFTYDAALKRLTLRAGGALSSDVPLRVRNSGDTAEIFEVRGNGVAFLRGRHNVVSDTADGESCFDGANFTNFGLVYGAAALGAFTIGYQANMIGAGTVGFRHVGEAKVGFVSNGSIEMYASTTPSKFDVPTWNMWGHNNGTDIHPRIRTQLGHLIDLFRQDLPTNPTTAQIATFLSNIGLANLI